MNLNPKKIIGSLGRRYGGKPFQKIRKVYYDALSLMKQCHEIFYLSKGEYAPNHSDKKFFDKYYSDSATVSEDSIKQGVICLCDGRMFHGGPTDRLRGILTTYNWAKKAGYKFYIKWNNPFELEQFLVPGTFDWRIKDEDLIYDKENSFPFIIEDETDFESFLRMKFGFSMHGRKQLHVYSNADNSRGNYKELYEEVFRPSDRLKEETEKHLKVLGKNYTAVTFRFLQLLGDFKEWSEETLDEDSANDLIQRVSDEFFRITKDIKLPDRILVTSDSKKFLDYISSKDKRVYIVPGDVKNIDLLKGEFPEAWLKTFVDQQLLMKASKVTLMRTGKMYKSGFPRFAAEVGGAKFIDHQF